MRGGLIHADITKSAVPPRASAQVHLRINDASRIAVTARYPDGKAVSATAALRASVAHDESPGVKANRVMGGNGPRSTAKTIAAACQNLKLKHMRTTPCTHKTKGKAAIPIRTALQEWAYARAYEPSDQRKNHLPAWTHMHNWHRPHCSPNSKPPISRIDLPKGNLFRFQS